MRTQNFHRIFPSSPCLFLFFHGISYSCFCTKFYSVQFINKKYHRRWKIQMAAWRLRICERDLCIFFLSHPCFACLCRVTAVDRTASITAGRHRAGGPGCCSTQAREGKNEHRKFSMREFHPVNWGSGQANLAMPCCLQFLCHHHANPYSWDHSNWNVVVLFGTAMAKVPVSMKLPGLPMPTWFCYFILWFFDLLSLLWWKVKPIFPIRTVYLANAIRTLYLKQITEYICLKLPLAPF